MTTLWAGVVAAALGCYLLKLAGVSLPSAALDRPQVRSVAALLPVAMLAALVVVQLLDAGGRVGVDWHVVAGVLAGLVVLLVWRAGVLTVFLVAVATTALLRLLL